MVKSVKTVRLQMLCNEEVTDAIFDIIHEEYKNGVMSINDAVKFSIQKTHTEIKKKRPDIEGLNTR